MMISGLPCTFPLSSKKMYIRMLVYCWVILGLHPVSPKYPKIHENLTDSAEFAVRYPGWIRQQMQAWRDCGCESRHLFPESPGMS